MTRHHEIVRRPEHVCVLPMKMHDRDVKVVRPWSDIRGIASARVDVEALHSVGDEQLVLVA